MSSDRANPDDTGAALTGEHPDSGRSQAFAMHWANCQRSVRAYLGSFLSDRSLIDDCVQEVAVIAWKKGPTDEGDSAFLGHVLATARLVALAAIRKNQNSRLQAFSPEVAVALAEKVAAQEQAEQDSANQRLTALRQCLGKLEPEPRALLEARYFSEGGERVKAEAQRLGKSLDALYKKLERLRDLLRACVSAQIKTLE
jgi:RNA polymerase sigma factor (sigma-70 family)